MALNSLKSVKISIKNDFLFKNLTFDVQPTGIDILINDV